MAPKKVKSKDASGGGANKHYSINLKQEIIQKKLKCLLVTWPKSIKCLSSLSVHL